MILKHNTLPSLCVLCLTENNDLHLSKTIGVFFNVTFQHKRTTSLVFQKSTTYKRNNLLYNKIINVLEKIYSVLKCNRQPFPYQLLSFSVPLNDIIKLKKIQICYSTTARDISSFFLSSTYHLKTFFVFRICLQIRLNVCL